MILLVSPVAAARVHGNAVTARRWAAILRSLGHEVRSVVEDYQDGSYSMLIALHARKSADAVRAFRARHPGAPVVLGLTGTDLYPDLGSAGVPRDVLSAADRLIVLQAHALRQLDSELGTRARVIVQSAQPIDPEPPRVGVFEVATLAHLREVKDPLRAAHASRLLPESSRIRIIHAGAELDERLGSRARAETAANPRYEWCGDLPHSEATAVLARSRLLLVTSRDEGGANVVSEALAAQVPVLSSDIPGTRGLLGDDYPGYFPVGDSAALAARLSAAETDRDGCYTDLVERCRRLVDTVDPRREREAWASLLAELSLPVTV